MAQCRGCMPCTAGVLTGAAKSFIKCNHGGIIIHTSGNETGMGATCTEAFFVE